MQTALLAPYRSLRICSVLAPCLHGKFLAAYVSVFMKRTTKPGEVWGTLDRGEDLNLSLVRIERFGSCLESRKTVRGHILHGHRDRPGRHRADVRQPEVRVRL